MKHNKNNNESCEKLKEKLNEETDGFFVEGNEEKLAKVLEVLEKIRAFKGLNKREIEWERGVFHKRRIPNEILN